MKKILYILCVMSFVSKTKSQNLVPNPSFEIDTACAGGNKIYYARPWFQPCIHNGNTSISSSSDLFGSCAPSYSGCGVPTNADGFQYARTGGHYAGIFTFTDTLNIREYIEVPIISPLISNHNYCVEFYVSLANSYGAAISNIGSYFSIDSLIVPTYKAIDSLIPQIENPISNILSDTANWILVSGSFVANGGEKFMTIGNFHNPANTNTQVVNVGASNFAKYEIDDVSVVDCGGVGVEEVSKETDIFKLYPNPSNGIFTLGYNLQLNEIGVMTIYDITGKLIRSLNFSSSNTNINISELQAGAYLYDVLISGKKVKNDRLIIIK